MWPTDLATGTPDLDEVRRTLDHLAHQRTTGGLTTSEATLYRRLARLELDLLRARDHAG